MGGCFEFGARDIVEAQRFRNKGDGLAIRRAADATLEGADRLGAQTRQIRQVLLKETRCGSMLPQ